MEFLQIDSSPGELSSYEAQCQLVDLLRAAFTENTQILADKGFDHPTELGGLFGYPEHELPDEFRQARRIIDAAGNVWRSLFHGDKVQSAHAGIWLGLILGPEQVRQYNTRNAKQSRSEEKEKARLLFNSRSDWDSAKDFHGALDREKIPTTTHRQVQEWYSQFNKS